MNKLTRMCKSSSESEEIYRAPEVTIGYDAHTHVQLMTTKMQRLETVCMN